MATTQYKLNLPDDVKAWLDERSAKNMRSRSAEMIFVLRKEMAAGGEIGVYAPAAGSENAALTRGASINKGNGDAQDD